MCAYGPERHPGLQKKKQDQQIKGASIPLLCPHEIPPGVLYPTLGSSAQQRHRPGAAGPEEAPEVIREQECRRHLFIKKPSLGFFLPEKLRGLRDKM